MSADIIDEQKAIDGLVVWDWLCGTTARKCPKIENSLNRATTVGQFVLPPPCIYLFPGTIPSPRNNPHPAPQNLEDVGILEAMHLCFGGDDSELNQVSFKAGMEGVELVRTTKVVRGNIVRRESKPTAIKRR